MPLWNGVYAGMPYATHRDREPHLLELEQTPWPAPPLNLFMISGYLPGVYDLTWSDPSNLTLNSRFRVCGVNLYRSFDSEYGPFDRITELPVGSVFWRDQTDNVLEMGEVVTDDCWSLRGAASVERHGERYVFRTQRRPIVKPGSQNLPADHPADVQVLVNGVQARVLAVYGDRGEVELDAKHWVDVSTQTRTTPILPEPGDEVTVSYRWNRTFLRTDLQQRVFYRVTTVGAPAHLPVDTVQAHDLVETPLERAATTSNAEIEKLDWIWKESVRRNRWILDQGGERVKVFLKKQVGTPCLCNRADYKQPINQCRLCYGTGVLGGYEGPYDIVMAPDDAERRIAQKAEGRMVEHQYEVWTGPTPLLSQRDFIVKIDGTRYSVGPVRRPTNRGMILQQHFNIGHVDEKDIRYSVPMDNPRGFSHVGPAVPPDNSPAGITDKHNIPDERELRGRSVVWSNIVY